MDNLYKNLAYAVIDQAVRDYHVLRNAGVIIDGKVIDSWPIWKGEPLRVSMTYDKRHKVSQLLHWFKNGALHDLLELTNSQIDAEYILLELGIIDNVR